MLFMVIERFRDNDMVPVYQRLRDVGRSLPDGLDYVDSWVEANFGRCFQLMRCDDARLIQQWILQWRGLGATFEVVPVVTGKETTAVVAPFLEQTAGKQEDETRRLCNLDTAPAYMFDTNVFNHVLHGNIPLPALAGKRILSTGVQRDELNKTKDPLKRDKLLEIFNQIVPEIMHASSFLFGVEGAGFDQAYLNDGSGNFDKMLGRLGELDAKNKRRRNRDKEELKLNQLRDISIAETAIKTSAILVSDDLNLQQVVSESGGRAIGHLEFLSSTSRAAGWGAACDPFDETPAPRLRRPRRPGLSAQRSGRRPAKA
jgi:Protein of unknown function (DUF3303)